MSWRVHAMQLLPEGEYHQHSTAYSDKVLPSRAMVDHAETLGVVFTEQQRLRYTNARGYFMEGERQDGEQFVFTAYPSGKASK